MNIYAIFIGLMATLIIIGWFKQKLIPIALAFIIGVILMLIPGSHMISIPFTIMSAIGLTGVYMLSDGSMFTYLNTLLTRAYGAAMVIISLSYILSGLTGIVNNLVFMVLAIILFIMVGLMVNQFHDRDDYKYSCYQNELDLRIGLSIRDFVLIGLVITLLIRIALTVQI